MLSSLLCLWLSGDNKKNKNDSKQEDEQEEDGCPAAVFERRHGAHNDQVHYYDEQVKHPHHLHHEDARRSRRFAWINPVVREDFHHAKHYSGKVKDTYKLKDSKSQDNKGFLNKTYLSGTTFAILSLLHASLQ